MPGRRPDAPVATPPNEPDAAELAAAVDDVAAGPFVVRVDPGVSDAPFAHGLDVDARRPLDELGAWLALPGF